MYTQGIMLFLHSCEKLSVCAVDRESPCAHSCERTCEEECLRDEGGSGFDNRRGDEEASPREREGGLVVVNDNNDMCCT